MHPQGHQVEVYARGYGELARVDVVRSGETVHTALPALDLPTGWTAVPLRVEWGSSPTTTDWSGRLEVADGELVRPDFWSPEIVAAEASAVRWVAETLSFGEPYGAPARWHRGHRDRAGRRRGQRRHRTGRPDLPLSELVGRVVEVPTGSAGRLRLQPGVGWLGGLGSAEHRLRWTDTDTDSETEPAWWYARVYQTDGEMAWSSPVRVDPG